MRGVRRAAPRAGSRLRSAGGGRGAGFRVQSRQGHGKHRQERCELSPVPNGGDAGGAVRAQQSRQAPEGKGCIGARAPQVREPSGFSSVPVPTSRVCQGCKNEPLVRQQPQGRWDLQRVRQQRLVQTLPLQGRGDRGCGSRLASLRHLGGQGPPPACDAPDPRLLGLWAGGSLPRPLLCPLGIPPGPPMPLTSQRANIFIHSLKLNLPIFHYQIPSWCHLPHAGVRLSFTAPEINIRCL